MHDAPRPKPGFRLEKLEVSNWGTFDSSRGTVHVVRPCGATTLLIGQNGSGKSTLVDALLTLFVRPVVRNYNVAAGAQKTERDERSYVKGAFDRRSRDEDNRAEVKFLRPDGKHYSTLLATFKNERGEAFTVAQVLYLGGDGGVEKVYAFAQEERSIAEHCANLATTERVKQQLEKRGFRATDKYTEYYGWIAKLTGMQPKAMDVFNQTVAVKDIQSLNRFIREHMLEPKPWMEKIETLQTHFTQLTEAYQSLVRVRRQFELLTPIAAKGAIFTEQSEALRLARSMRSAASPYFRAMTVELLGPAADSLTRELSALVVTRERLDSSLRDAAEQERQLKNEIENAGGERLRQLPLLIRQHETESTTRRERSTRFAAALVTTGIGAEVTDDAALRSLHQRLPEYIRALGAREEALRREHQDVVLDRGDAHRELSESKRELEALGTRHTKLPESHMEIRRQLCEALRLPDSELPFAAELIAVPAEEKSWEATIELVLRSFALSLLVPQKHYAVVSAHIDRNRIRDGRGFGQKLVYLRVGGRAAPHSRPVVHPQSLLGKVKVKDGHGLAPWVKGELEERFDYLCCDTIEQFQAAHDMALTRERHIKGRGSRHEKDDRDRAVDPRAFVLGWDNREKRKAIADNVRRLEDEIRDMDARINNLNAEIAGLDGQRRAAQVLQEINSFALIDFESEQLAIAALREEKRALEESSEALKLLRARVAEVEAAKKRLSEDRDQAIRQHERASQDLRFAERQIEEASRLIMSLRQTGEWARHEALFPALSKLLEHEPLTAHDVTQREAAFLSARQAEVERLTKELEPLEREICRLMNQYLRDFPDQQADLDASIEYLQSFSAACEQIRREGLPRHENRFKERLNEKVTQEIGILNGAFQTEKQEIEQKIDVLNRSLRQLEYRPGTYMKLEPRAVRDAEIQQFQASLRECLADSFEGTLAADEARYVRIAKLIQRLREEQRWREKVTDVRRWFDFAARELDAESGAERHYYEDSAGQSGGEKAKLAFTILVAAIAYQFDIDPARPSSDRFHFVVVDEMFSKVDDRYAEYALRLFRQFGLQLLIVAPLDAKARVTEPYVECYLHVVKDPETHNSEIFSMTAREFEDTVLGRPAVVSATTSVMRA
jgi:uncharacterized protein YPO0396